VIYRFLRFEILEIADFNWFSGFSRFSENPGLEILGLGGCRFSRS